MFVQPLKMATLVVSLALLPACELIASFDRDEIPEPGFMLPDARVLPDASVIDGALPETDGSTDAGEDMDASVDGGEPDANDMDAMVDSGDDSDAGADSGM